MSLETKATQSTQQEDETASQVSQMPIDDGVERGRSMKAHESFCVQSPEAVTARKLDCLPHYMVRCTDNKSQYFVHQPCYTFKLNDTARIHLRVYRLIKTSNYDWALEQMLDYTYPYYQSCVGTIIDEMAGILYIVLCRSSKTQPEYQRATIKQFHLIFGPVDRFGNKSLDLKFDRRRYLTLDLPLGTFQPFVWPADGTLFVYGTTVSEQEVVVKVGWLEANPNSHRVRYVRLFNNSTRYPLPEPRLRTSCNIVLDSHTVYALSAFTSEPLLAVASYKKDIPSAWGSLKISESCDSKFESTDPSLEIKTEKLTEKLALLENSVSYMKIVGKLFRAWLVVFTTNNKECWLLGFRINRHGSILCELKLRSPECSTFHFFPPTLVAANVTESEKLLLSKIQLNDQKYAKQLKIYRFCANCGKQERKKRKDASGKRISDFKVCRECKTRELHHSWQNHPCHYCSWTCVKADWSKHKLLHADTSES